MLKRLIEEYIELLRDKKHSTFLSNDFTIIALKVLIGYKNYIYYCSDKKSSYTISQYQNIEDEKYRNFIPLLDSIILFGFINNLNFDKIFKASLESSLKDPLNLLNLMVEDLDSLMVVDDAQYEEVLNSIVNICIAFPTSYEAENLLKKRILHLKK